MALARVRGCAGQARPAAQAASGSTWQADASRRRSGPRKATSRRPITVRLRSKSCPAGGHMTSPDLREKGSSGHGRPRTSQQADVGSKTRSAGRVPTKPLRPGPIAGSGPESEGTSRRFATGNQRRRGIEMEITFKGRHTSVPERFRRHASAKLAKLEKLDHNAIRIDVEVSTERNPRQADRSERVELTIRSRGPAIRAEAAADDRYAALDLAFAKLEGRLRKAAERRKVRRGELTVRSADSLAAVAAPVEADTLAQSAALADVAIPAIPRPDDAAMLGGTPVGRKAGKSASRHNGHKRPTTTVPLPDLADDDALAEFSAFRETVEEEAVGVLPMQMV